MCDDDIRKRSMKPEKTGMDWQKMVVQALGSTKDEPLSDPVLMFVGVMSYVCGIHSSFYLSFFGHLVRMYENADDSQVISERPPESWRRPPGWSLTTWMKTIQGDLSSLDLELHEARELAQNRPLWRLMSLYSATHS